MHNLGQTDIQAHETWNFYIAQPWPRLAAGIGVVPISADPSSARACGSGPGKRQATNLPINPHTHTHQPIGPHGLRLVRGICHYCCHSCSSKPEPSEQRNVHAPSKESLSARRWLPGGGDLPLHCQCCWLERREVPNSFTSRGSNTCFPTAFKGTP